MEREIKTFFDYDNAPFSNMVLGEVLNRPGKWSSYPPHHHPQPEVYFYRFDYPHGFGAGFANGDVYKTEQNGCAVINHGFHSQVVAPGYAMCYAWGIRHLLDNVPHKCAAPMRNQLVGHFGKTTYYRFYRQEQGLFPKAQAYIRQVFKQYGIAEEPKFERYSEEYSYND